MDESKLEYMFEPICERFLDLSLDANGLCVIKKFIQKFKKLEKKQAIVQILLENVITLVQSPFGNYAIQTAIETMNQEDLMGIYMSLAQNVLQLSI